jgi:CRP/FNR family transcriptional regulator, cyclic AMP receptor protein
MQLSEVFAWLAAAITLITFFSRTIVPLRVFALAGNAAYLLYAVVAGISTGHWSNVLPTLLLHSVLLPVNVVRLRQVTTTIKAVRAMKDSDGAPELLTPYMKAKQHKAGTTLFRIDEPADLVYVLKTGQVRLVEFDKQLRPNALFGEVAIFSDSAVRTATALCETDCEIFEVSGERILELFYQDQRFAMLIARRLAAYA